MEQTGWGGDVEMNGIDWMRLHPRGLRCFKMKSRSELWLEEETVSQTEKVESAQEIPARRSTVSFSLSQPLWLRTCEMYTESKSLSMRMMSAVVAQKEAELYSVPCDVSLPRPILMRVLESPVM